MHQRLYQYLVDSLIDPFIDPFISRRTYYLQVISICLLFITATGFAQTSENTSYAPPTLPSSLSEKLEPLTLNDAEVRTLQVLSENAISGIINGIQLYQIDYHPVLVVSYENVLSPNLADLYVHLWHQFLSVLATEYEEQETTMNNIRVIEYVIIILPDHISMAHVGLIFMYEDGQLSADAFRSVLFTYNNNPDL